MPESVTIYDMIPKPVSSGLDDYPEETGREIWDSLSITGLNRSPIHILTAFIANDFNETHSGTAWPLIPVDILCEYVLVDGSFAVRLLSDKDMQDGRYDEQYLFLKDCKEIHRRLVIQRIRNKQGMITDTVRVYQRTEKDWIVRDVKNYGKDGEQTQHTVRYPLEAFYAYPGGKGVIWENQKTYKRLEEISYGIRNQTGPASLALIVSGYIGEIKKAQQTFESGAKIVYVPGGATITRVASNNTADQLMSDFEQKLHLFLKNIHLVEISETADMSGVARRLAMTPMIHFSRLVRAALTLIYKDLGYEVTFGGLGLLTPAERSDELDFLTRLRTEGHIDEAEFKLKARRLAN